MKYPLRVVSVERSLFEGDVEYMIANGADGELGVLARHVLRDGNLDRGAERVIERCRELGAPDNVTLAVARVEGNGSLTLPSSRWVDRSSAVSSPAPTRRVAR